MHNKDNSSVELPKTSSDQSEFDQIITSALSRRQFLSASSALGVGAFLAANPMADAVAAAGTPSKLMGFDAIPTSTADNIVVPEGYSVNPLISWGDPIFPNAPTFDPSGKAPSSAQEMQFGDNTDGMSLFPLSDNRALLAINNEYTNYKHLFDHKGEKMTADDVKKAQAAHGVTVFEIRKAESNNWQLVKESKYNRRITANTEMELTGPAAGHDLLKTAADPSGRKPLGTFNNCANGQTPWGTYLTCEENFNGYFGAKTEVERTEMQKRYGIKTDSKYQWFEQDDRFDIGMNPQEPNRHGWVVEIDPMDPTSTPKKRTALGRFKHENAAVTLNNDGHVIVYLGDDERGEHLYKFVSKNRYNPSNKAANRNLLEDGTLYAAQFNANEGELKGKGQWLELTHGKNGLTKENGFADQAEVMIFARKAATQVGATTMDRPEWVAVNPNNKQVFCTLTNNKYRGVKENQPVNSANPRVKNPYGHIVRWEPTNADHTSGTFDWDLYLIAGNPIVHKEGLMAGSSNINPDNMFNSPDGIGFDGAGRLWIQTDGNYKNKGDFTGQGNNQMLCGDPETGEVRRFMTGPIACEITGLTFSTDYRTMFVGIQHPDAHFPHGGDSKPRSTVIMVTRKDGGTIGS